MRSTGRCSGWLVLLVATGLLCVPGARADITVTEPFDLAGNGQCSLDEALAAAVAPATPSSECPGAAVAGTTTIRVPAGTYSANAGAHVPIPSGAAIAIEGAGSDASQTRITSSSDRLLDIPAGATVSLTDLKVFASIADNGHAGTSGNGSAGSTGGNGGVGVAGGAGSDGGNGLPGGNGGAVRNAGTLNVTNVIFDQDSAGGGGMGGAGGSGGTGGARDPASSVSPSGGNGGGGGNGAAAGSGGAIANSGTLTVSHSVFSNDTAGHGGVGGPGGSGGVGGSPSGTAFLGGQGGPGASGGSGGGAGGNGGAILNTGTATISDTAFSDDAAGQGGSPGSGGHGGTGYSVPNPGSDHNTFAGPGGNGGSPGSGGTGAGGDGGAIYTTGTLHLTNVTIDSAAAGAGGGGGIGGPGGDGGAGFTSKAGQGGNGGSGAGATAGGGRGGGVYAAGGTVTIDSSTIGSSHGGKGGQGGFGGSGGTGGSSSAFSGNGGTGGNGSAGGNGGAIAFSAAVVTVTNATLTGDGAGIGGTGGTGGNSGTVFALPGAGGNGGNSGNGGSGGGIFATLGGGAKADLKNVTVALDKSGVAGQTGAGGSGSPAGNAGSAGLAAIYGGLAETGATGSSQITVTDTLVASNTTKNCLGVVDGGHNLSFGDATCPGANGDPKLGELQDNGGAAPTQGLGAGSAAIDAGAGCPATDERGLARPQGSACDIGAFERGAPPVCQDFTVHVGYATSTDISAGCSDATGAPATIIIDTDPVHGGAIGTTGGAGGTVQYNAFPGYVGPDPFTFHATTGDGTSAVRTATIIVDPPAAPTLAAVAPTSPAGNRSPHFSGTAPAGTTVQLFTTSDCSGTPAATGTPAAFASPGLVVDVPSDSTTTVRAAYVNSSSVTSACSAPVTYVEDETAPDTVIDDGPSSTTSEAKPTFTYHASETAAAFACSLDQGTPAFAACPAAGFTPALPLAPGTYTFRVQATDLVGLTDASPATRTFTVTSASASPGPSPAPTPGAVGTLTPTPSPTFAPALTVRGAKTTRKGGAVKLSLRVANAGNATDTLKLKGPTKKAGARLRYRLGRKTVTKPVSKGTLSLTLAPGAARVMTVTVKPIRRKVKLTFTATSAGRPAAQATARRTVRPRAHRRSATVTRVMS